MTNEITITFPAIPAQVIADLNETETILAATEVEFIHALRAKYGDLARYNGYIKTSHYAKGDSNYSEEGDTWLRNSEGKIKGLLASDNFTTVNDSQNDGRYTGSKLYLIYGDRGTHGWVEISRAGHWSNWQGSANYWSCDGTFADDTEFDGAQGEVRWLTDEEVAGEYSVQKVATTLAATLTDLAGKLSQRLTRKRTLAESLQTITAQLAKFLEVANA